MFLRLFLSSAAVALLASNAWASGYTMLNAGIAALRRDDNDKAVEYLTTALKSPDFPARFKPVAYYDRASAHIGKQDYASALSDLNAALATRSDWFDALELRAVVKMANNQPDGAIVDFTAAISVRPDLAGPYLARAAAYDQLKKFDLALADDTMAIDLGPKSVVAYQSRASTYEQEGRYDLALPDIRKAADLSPRENATLLLERGIAEWATGRADDAIDSFRDARKPAGSKVGYAYIWLAIARASKDPTSSQTETADPIDQWPNPILQYYAGKIGEADVFAKARLGPSDATEGQECEAEFYVGEWNHLHKIGSDTVTLFQKAQLECPPAFIERRAASFELTRIGAPKS